MTELRPSLGDPEQGVTADPSDNTTLREVLAGYEASGFDATFSPTPEATIECEACGSNLAAARFTIQSLRRLEGASDPDDMVAVVATTCPSCGARGLLVLGFGPMAAAEDGDILAGMNDGRSQAPLPADASPAETADRPRC